MRNTIHTLAILLFFCSCKNNPNNSLTVYRVAEEGFQRSSKNISLATNLVYHAIEEKIHAPETREVAMRWQPVADKIKELSDSIVKYINGLKEELKNEAGGSDSKNKDWENSMGVSEHLFESHGKGKELLGALIKYKEALLALDPELKSQFGNNINIFSNEFIFAATDTVAFTRTFFSSIPVIAANVMLSKFVNNVKVCENETVTYCYNKIGFLDGASMYDKFVAIVGQSSNYVKAGDNLEISAGVGSFSTASNPVITINGRVVPLTADGVAIHKFKTSQKAGRNFVPVKIEYTKPDGTKEIKTFNIEYTIIEPE